MGHGNKKEYVNYIEETMGYKIFCLYEHLTQRWIDSCDSRLKRYSVESLCFLAEIVPAFVTLAEATIIETPIRQYVVNPIRQYVNGKHRK